MSSDNDSDNDDLLNAMPTFTSKQKAKEDKKIDKMDDYLTLAFTNTNARQQSRKRMYEIPDKKDEMDVDSSEADRVKEEQQQQQQQGMEKQSSIDWNKLDNMIDEVDRESNDLLNKRKKANRRGICDDVLDSDKDEDEASFGKLDGNGENGTCITGLSTGLGTRHVLGYFDSDTSSDIFEDMDTAYKDLQDNIFALCDDQLLQLIATKAKRRRTVKKNLPDLLYTSTLTSIYSGETLLGPPFEFIKWLWKVALSGCRVGLTLHQGAQRTLMAFINFRKESLFKNLLSSQSFHNELKNVFGFQASKVPCESTKTRIGNDKDYIYPDADRSLDMSAFENFLKLWIHGIRSDIVSWECKGQLNGLSAILTTVIRIGLDAQFHVTQKDIMCRRDIFKYLQHFMEIIIDKLEDLSPSEQILDSIIKSIVKSLRDLKCGPPSSEDADDENGVLPLALATRNIPITKMHDNALLHLGCVQFKTRFAKHAFFSCNSCDAQSWKEVHSKFESKLGLEIAKSVKAETKLRSAWRVFIDGAVAFYEVYRLSGFWEDDCPRCYASIDIADSLMRASRMLLLNMHESLGEVDDAKSYAVCKAMFDYGEHYCNETKKSISAVFTHPHLRRAKEYLTTLSIYFSRLKEDADRRTGVVKISSKQRKMSSFFKPIAAIAQ